MPASPLASLLALTAGARNGGAVEHTVGLAELSPAVPYGDIRVLPKVGFKGGGVVAVRGTVLCPVWSAPLGVKGKGGLAGASVRYI